MIIIFLSMSSGDESDEAKAHAAQGDSDDASENGSGPLSAARSRTPSASTVASEPATGSEESFGECDERLVGILAQAHREGKEPDWAHVVKPLIIPGAAREKDDDGMLPLHLALLRSAPPGIVEAMFGAYPAAAMEDDSNGRSPISLAAAEGNDAALALFLSQPAVLESPAASKALLSAHLAATAKGHDKCVQAINGCTAGLSIAAKAQLLLLLWAACGASDEAGVRAAIREGGDALSQVIDSRDESTEFHDTAVTACCRRGLDAILGVLIAKRGDGGGGGGADVEATILLGRTPLFVASAEGHGLCCEALVAAGAAVNKARDDGTSPLYMSAWNGHDMVCALLLSHGADANQAANDGWSPLCISAMNEIGRASCRERVYVRV